MKAFIILSVSVDFPDKLKNQINTVTKTSGRYFSPLQDLYMY
jgi:hypothetical protein